MSTSFIRCRALHSLICCPRPRYAYIKGTDSSADAPWGRLDPGDVMLNPRIIAVAVAVSVITSLSGCNGSPQTESLQGRVAGSGVAESRSGQSYDVTLASEVDGESIAFTIHEPDELRVGQSYPLILHSHGYSGTRRNAAARPADSESLFGRLLANGYGVLSLDERGHGESGGFIRVLDPDYAGADWLQVLDWTELNLEWLMLRADSNGQANPVMGAMGGSYGGGFQHLIYRIDEKDRLDVMVPDITWHDLNYSLYNNRVFKTYWGALLSAGGNALANGQHHQVNVGLARGVALNQLSAQEQFLLYRNSLAYNCDGHGRPLRKIDGLYTQSALDTLFNFNEAVDNFECVQALGGDVRFMIKPAGHSGGEHGSCGRLSSADATFAFFEEKLYQRQNAADFVPQYCFHLGSGGEQGLVLDRIPHGHDQAEAVTVAVENLLLHELQDNLLGATALDLGLEAGPQGDAIVGIPAIEIEILDPLLGLENPVEPILFVALGRSSDGGASWTPIMDQVTPYRGYGKFVDELVGVSVKLEPGEKVGLMLYPSHSGQYPSSGSSVPALVNVQATVKVPMIGLNHPPALGP